ncbi:hypothetical protein H4R33_006245 [Dimargaris cristalligena]|uniref:Uncharacterized protein n=1 Tax=Dimargaris cristalligena TaxID=215637 RepID=A0A4P9ZPE3_9FUNG|nr:hypothetical protein H4R33_006245 [Dimargaris cristalligena]RKP35068.1 hypothetical protein BJ085DRAFT_39638 [Dimargaris cristalligena]|eukprot:RKP35068.1 hypothetical protein BJ085DRAFT_39638 [Dimargaris cristalligena]
MLITNAYTSTLFALIAATLTISSASVPLLDSVPPYSPALAHLHRRTPIIRQMSQALSQTGSGLLRTSTSGMGKAGSNKTAKTVINTTNNGNTLYNKIPQESNNKPPKVRPVPSIPDHLK